MAIMAPHDAPAQPPGASPSDSSPSVPRTEIEPTQTVPIESPLTSPETNRGTAAQGRRGALGGLILVAIGVSALFATWLPGGGAWLFLGLGSAFLLARILVGRSGYAVPAGILLGFGTFVLLTEAGYVIGPATGGLFFICLGVGFLASYAIAARPEAVWPILPGLVLIGFGAFVEASTFGAPFVGFWGLAQFWPLILVAIGAWLLFRERVPADLRTPIALGGTAVLILLGLLVAASAVATAGIPYAGGATPVLMPWPMVQVPFGTPPVQDTITLSAPVDSVSAIRVVNTNGTTLVRSTTDPRVTVSASRHFWNSAQPPDVRLVPADGVLTVESSAIVPGASGTYIDYVIDVPASMGADVRSASGSVTVSGLGGPVQVATTSGPIDAHSLRGTTSFSTASGGIRMDDVSGDVRASSASGRIYGTGISRISDAHSTSGGIDLRGDFTSNAQIASVSGTVALTFTPAASVHIDAASLSGDVHATGLHLNNQSSAPHALSGDLGSGGPTLAVRTTSGSIRLLGST